MQTHKALLIPVGLFVAALATWVASYFETRVLESHFEQTARRYSLAVEKELAVAVESMHILKGLYDGSQFVDAEEFSAATSDIFHRRNEVVSFAWLLPHNNADGNAEAYRLTYLEQNASHADSNAVDATIAEIDIEAFHRVRDSGRPALVEYSAGAQQSSSGVHILVPIYKPVSPSNVAVRRQQLQGVVVGSYAYEQLLQTSVWKALDPHVSYQVTSLSGVASAPQSVFAISANDGAVLSDMSFEQQIAAVDRRWLVTVTASVMYLKALRSYLPELVGVCLLALVAAFAWMMRQSERVTQDVAYQVVERTKALNSANRRLQQLARTDYLTGLPNRRSFDEALEEATEQRKSVGLILIDVDYFKHYNDHYGHQAGDDCLQQVSQVLRAVTQAMPDVFVSRYGGEEFAVLATEHYHLGSLAEALREAVSNLGIRHRRSSVAKVITISLGVLEPQRASVELTAKKAAEALLMRADKALYLAKASGRNQVYIAEAEAEDGLAIAVADVDKYAS